MLFYHGTSSAIQIQKCLLPPIITNIKREGWRKKYVDKVFFTTSLATAKKFAKKACEKYGGIPTVYIVRPIGEFFNTINGEFIADRAKVIEKIV